MLTLDGVSVAYGEVTVLHEIDLHIDRGDQVALIGPSGAGKTTLLNRLYKEHPQQAALIHQDYALVPRLSVLHNVLIGRLDHHDLWHNLRNLVWPYPQEVVDVRGVLAHLGLETKLRQRVSDLSGGQRQRTAVARALYRGASLLFADEPVSSVDPHRAGSVLNLLKQRVETVVISLHSVALAREHFTRLIGLREGRIFFDLPTEEVGPELLDKLFEPC